MQRSAEELRHCGLARRPLIEIVEQTQADLDTYLETSNHKRPHRSRGLEPGGHGGLGTERLHWLIDL